ncbi:MAG TPA: hypothetical protein VER55_09385 [Ardenticatenaceae bacterium]|nr:hypothetical protein [Ardenticatenaceae bacterium]
MMSERNGWSGSDEQLLEKIDAILAGKEVEGDNPDSLYGFCVQLASAVPQADDAFRERLEAQLVARVTQRATTRSRTDMKAPVPMSTRPQAKRDLRTPHWSYRPVRSALRPVLRSAIGFLVLLAILFAAFPDLRVAAAVGLDKLRGALAGISCCGRDGMATFNPKPPFTVKQPEYLPDGFKQVATSYQPADDAVTWQSEPRITLQEVPAPGAEAPHEGVLPNAERESVAGPHVVLTYSDDDGRYFQLFERAARPDESLPSGEARRVRGLPATLLRGPEELTLIWIEEQTWIELAGTITEAELLKVAEGLVTMGEPESTSDVLGEASPERLAREFPYCDDPETHLLVSFANGLGPKSVLRVHVADDPLMGRVRGQQFSGSVVIRLMNPANTTDPVEVAYGGSSIENSGKDLLETALSALRDPALQMKQLRYPSLGVQLQEDTEPPCLAPSDPDEQGYVVVEVWEDQVNVGFGGAGEALKPRVIEALEAELQSPN